MRITTPIWLAALPTFCLVGCASVDNDVKVPPGSYTSHVLFMPLDIKNKPTTGNSTDDKLKWLMPLVEIDTEGFIFPAGRGVKDPGEKDKSPVYVAYDISKLEMGQFDTLYPGTADATATPAEIDAANARNLLVKRVLYLSDKNFDSYTLRGQTYNDGEQLASDSLNTVGTATIGGTALIAPPAAAGIALAKLLTDSTYNNVQNTFLGGQTVDALFKAMAANRAKFKTQMINKLFGTNGPSLYGSYPMIDVLGDFRELNRISTLHGALEDLSQQASTQVQAANTAASQISTSQTTLAAPVLAQKLNATAADGVNAVK
jgi:hypothetical protein